MAQYFVESAFTAFTACLLGHVSTCFTHLKNESFGHFALQKTLSDRTEGIINVHV